MLLSDHELWWRNLKDRGVIEADAILIFRRQPRFKGQGSERFRPLSTSVEQFRELPTRATSAENPSVCVYEDRHTVLDVQFLGCW